MEVSAMADLMGRVQILEHRMGTVESHLQQNNAKFEAKFERLEARFDRVDGELVSLHGKISDVHGKMSDLQREMHRGFNDVHGRISDVHGRISDVHAAVNTQTRWILASLGAFFTAFMSAVAAMFYKLAPLLDALTRALRE